MLIYKSGGCFLVNLPLLQVPAGNFDWNGDRYSGAAAQILQGLMFPHSYLPEATRIPLVTAFVSILLNKATLQLSSQSFIFVAHGLPWLEQWPEPGLSAPGTEQKFAIESHLTVFYSPS